MRLLADMRMSGEGQLNPDSVSLHTGYWRTSPTMLQPPIRMNRHRGEHAVDAAEEEPGEYVVAQFT